MRTAQSHFKTLYRDINNLNTVWKKKYERMFLFLQEYKICNSPNKIHLEYLIKK